MSMTCQWSWYNQFYLLSTNNSIFLSIYLFLHTYHQHLYQHLTNCLNKLTISYAWQINFFRFMPLARSLTFVKVAFLSLNWYLKFVELNITIAHLWLNHGPQGKQVRTSNFAKLSCCRRLCRRTISQHNHLAPMIANHIELNELMSIYLRNSSNYKSWMLKKVKLFVSRMSTGSC